MKDTKEPSASDAADEPDLVALLGSRLCHDLVSPIGAIGNGLELLEMSGAAGGDEIGLIRSALDAAVARIRFFRLAFGAAAPSAKPISAREMREIVGAMYAQTRTTVLWRDEAERSRDEMRLACLALNCIEVATPWGGKVEVIRNEAAWVLHVDAERLKIDEPLWQSLGKAGVPSDLKGSEVQFGILSKLSRALRRPVSVSADARHLSLIV
ncbi:histidine phosphotransferase family protein [Jannaschia sp. KMU-145]|uniref:histidine phosphotransferase family protein n=1 Tax=Jannaschia halovivens TaxID=3388667 RepID=UPI00396B1F4B